MEETSCKNRECQSFTPKRPVDVEIFCWISENFDLLDYEWEDHQSHEESSSWRSMLEYLNLDQNDGRTKTRCRPRSFYTTTTLFTFSYLTYRYANLSIFSHHAFIPSAGLNLPRIWAVICRCCFMDLNPSLLFLVFPERLQQQKKKKKHRCPQLSWSGFSIRTTESTRRFGAWRINDNA